MLKINLTNKIKTTQQIKKHTSSIITTRVKDNSKKVVNSNFFQKIKKILGFRKKLTPKSFAPKVKSAKRPYYASRDSVAQSNNYVKHNFISSREKIIDGFKDGGRNCKFSQFGDAISSSREIIVVNKEYDEYLMNAINYAKKNTEGMNEKEKMNFLFKIVKEISGDPLRGDRRSTILAQNANGGEGLLGNFFKHEFATCRHKSLMYKILADEVGLNVRLIRGMAFDLQGFGGHAWNEVVLQDGKRMLVDIQNSHLINVATKRKINKEILAGYFFDNKQPVYKV